MAKKTGKKGEKMVMVGDPADADELDVVEEEEEEESSEKDDDEGEEEGEESEKAQKKSKGKDEDEDGDSDEDDERVGHGEDDEEETEEDGKGKTRESRKARRERQRRARRRNEVELNYLRTQNEQLERKVSELDTRVNKSEVGSIDQRIASVQSQMKVADQVFAKAVKNGDEDDITEATSIRDRLRDAHTKLTGVKTDMARRAQETEAEPEVDSRLVFHARAWMKDHNWYDPNGTDKDSRRVAAIDDQLVKQGFDPRTPEYWDELTDRVEKALPDRFKDARNGRGNDDTDEEEERGSRGNGSKRGRGPRFSTGGRERPLRKNEVYVSPGRKAAMIEAGVWDDKILRQKYLKRYAEYDRENPRGRAAR